MRRILFSAAKILISAALLYLALRKVDLSELFSRFTVSSLFWIGVAIAVAFLQIFVGVLRWREISAACGAPLELGRAMRYNVIGAFFNQTLPSAIGGDAIRLWLVARAGAGWRAATYSIFVDRAIGLIALAVLIVASLPWSYTLITDPHGRSALLLLDFAALAGGLGFLIFGALKWRWLKTWWATHHIHACAVIANRVIFSRSRGPIIAVLSVLVHVLAVVVAWCVVQAIAAPISFGQIFLLVPPVMLITMMPIS
ncbi:flippase-like domain-containing protein, partial [Bradyrhizobium sp. 160]|uniref:lysylphosphatidylglycerol synthase transmembrane domain-containing protein n=1 Tax=Bradyrhizobium sp. 160 TaxID=2782634 RepID=UPI001FFBD118